MEKFTISRPSYSLEVQDQFNAALAEMGASEDFVSFDMDSLTGFHTIVCAQDNAEQVRDMLDNADFTVTVCRP